MNRTQHETFSKLQRKIYLDKNSLTDEEKHSYHSLLQIIEETRNKCSVCEHNKVVGFRKAKNDSIEEKRCRIKNISTFNIEAINCNSFKLHLI